LAITNPPCSAVSLRQLSYLYAFLQFSLFFCLFCAFIAILFSSLAAKQLPNVRLVSETRNESKYRYIFVFLMHLKRILRTHRKHAVRAYSTCCRCESASGSVFCPHTSITHR